MTNDTNDFAALKPTTIVISDEEFEELTTALAQSNLPNDKLKKLFAQETVFDRPFELNP